MRPGKSIYIVFVLFVMANTGLGYLLTSKEMLGATALLISTSAALCMMRPLTGFAVIVAELLTIGFLAAAWAYIEVWPQHYQLDVIVKITAFMVSLGITWLMALQLKNILQVTGDVERLLTQLKKYEEDIEVLTFNEFLYRTEPLLVAMRRRGETGFLVRLSLDSRNKHFAMRTLYLALSQAALMATRNKYDLVGKVSEYELVLLLQNTTSEGTAIVIERIKEKLHELINVPPNMYNVDVKPLPDTWAAARQMIAGSVLPRRRERKAHGAAERTA